MKKVLIFSLSYFPHVGGAEVAIKEITRRVPSDDIEFHLITLLLGKENPRERIGNIEVYRIGRNYGYMSKIFFILHAAYFAYRLHRSKSFDAFWAMMSYMLFPVVMLRCVGVSVPYLLTLQEGDPWSHMFSRWFIIPFRPVLSYGFRHATVIQAISTYLGEWAKRVRYFGPIEIVPNGYITQGGRTDFEWFGTDLVEQDRQQFWHRRENLTVSHKNTILITTSRLVPKNAIDIAIKAMSSLPEEVIFVVLGKGKELERLKIDAHSLGVKHRVHFLGEKKNTDILYYLHASDIFIRPSRSEGMGNSFIEAMAAGLPVIATQEGGIADFLFDEKRNPDKPVTGWAVDTNSPEQIAAAVKDIMTHPEKMRAVVATAKAMVKEKYDWDVIARDMRTKVFEKLFSQQLV